MKITRDHPRLVGLSLVLAATAIGLMVAALFVGRNAGAGGLAAPPVENLPALANMSSLNSDRTAVPVEQFGSIAGLPAPVDGNVHVLSSGLGGGDVAISAWAAEKNQVCFTSSFGSAGCFGTFPEPFVYRISDTDRLGEGTPLYAWGFVPDSVKTVSAKVAGHDLSAVSAENNTAFIALSNASLFPDEIDGFTLTYEDGSSRFLPHAVVLPAELKKLKAAQ
jgi:hypothetical protein